MISVIIPTYKEPEVLDLCLESAIKGQKETNEIIVVVDGHYSVNEQVLEKHKDSISVLNLEENVGQVRATNLGVYNASSEYILIVNDDNVFPREWDVQLNGAYSSGGVLTPNQIEPTPSMFRQFHIKDLGRNPKSFDLEAFWKYEESIRDSKIEESGSTLPIFMSKKDYLKVGGWDDSYPGPWVVDWEFFMKCEMNGLQMLRTYNLNFYHFVSVGTKSPDRIAESVAKERECHEYFRYKWGHYATHNPVNNSKVL